MSSKLDALKSFSLVVADTGDLTAIRRYQPQDATTNPSLILNSFELPDYQSLINEELASISAEGGDRHTQVEHAVDRLAVVMGSEISGGTWSRVNRDSREALFQYPGQHSQGPRVD